MSCFNCFINLCEVLICDGKGTLTLPQSAYMSGIYRLILKFQGVALSFDAVFNVGDTLVFDIDCINENYCFEGHVYDPNMVPVIFLDTDGGKDGIRFCTLQSAICE